MYETNKIGWDIFAESLIRTPASLGVDTFDYVVLYNGYDPALFHYLRSLVGLSPARVRIVRQREADMPLPANRGKPVSLWKVCPPRLNIDVHEIVADNDLLFVRPFPKIAEFLASARAMLLRDPIRFYGSLDDLHPPGEAYNSGLLGLPPGYDFGQHVREVWLRRGRPDPIRYDDEQALLTHCLRHRDPIIVGIDEVKELLRDGKAEGGVRSGKNYQFTGQEYGFHFVEANRSQEHTQWDRYKKWMSMRAPKVSFL